jgi:hypothetical protein
MVNVPPAIQTISSPALRTSGELASTVEGGGVIAPGRCGIGTSQQAGGEGSGLVARYPMLNAKSPAAGRITFSDMVSLYFLRLIRL